MLLNQNNKKPSAPPADALVFDAGTVDFEDKVMRASMQTPVIVDFWAPWCGPCKQLGPVLEQAVIAAGGKVRMAKVNIDENPELAQAMRIQSIPMVFAFFGGQPVNGFVGLKAPGEIKAFIDQLIDAARKAQPDALDIPEALAGAAQALAEGDVNTAQAIYVQILGEDEMNVAAYTGLIRSFIAAGQPEHAQEMIDEAPEEIAKDPQFAAAKTALELASESPGGDLPALSAQVGQNPDDHRARFDLAAALFSSGQKERAIDELIEIVRRNRAWEEDKARMQLLKYFEALGPADPLTVAGRKKLSSVLFS